MMTKAEVEAMLDANQDAKVMRLTAKIRQLRVALDKALKVCRCREGECESKPTGCRMAGEIGTDAQ